MITIDQLQLFIAIAEKGTFRAAAGSLHRAQSAVSYGIQQLEGQLNVSLFERDQHRPSLTEPGQALLKLAKEVVASGDRMMALAQALQQGWEPELRLSLSALFPATVITPSLVTFQRESQGTNLKVNIEVLGGVDRVIDGEVQLAVTEYIQPQHSMQIETVPLLRTKMIAVAAPNHPLAKARGTIPQETAGRFVQIILSSTTPKTKDTYAGVINPALAWSTTSYDTKLNFIVGGLGWGTMPEYLISKQLKKRTLKALRIEGFGTLTVENSLIRKRCPYRKKGELLLWDLIQRQCHEQGSLT